MGATTQLPEVSFTTISTDNSICNSCLADLGVALDMGKFTAGVSSENPAVVHSEQKGVHYAYSPEKSYYLFLSYSLSLNSDISITPTTRFKTNFNGGYLMGVNGIIEMLLLGAGLETDGSETNGVYNVGFIAAKRVQLIGVIYSGVNQRWSTSHNNLELMLRVRIKNKSAQ